MTNPARGRSALTAMLVATAALAATAAPATAAAPHPVPPSAFGPVTAALDGHTLRGVPAPERASTQRAAAPGGSIVFIRANDVWLTRPDGSGMRRVTDDGTADTPYEHPTMSTDGVIAVMKGAQILRMSQGGKVLNRMTPEDLFVPDYGTIVISPITDPEISPDGTRIAYSQLRLEHYGGGDYSYDVTEAETAVTSATRFTEPTQVYLGYQAGWIGDSRFTLDRDGDVHLADLGHDAVPWYTSDDIFDTRDPLDPFIALNEPEVSPDRQRALFGIQNTGFAMTTTTSDPAVGAPGKPTAAPQCFLSSDDPKVYAEDATFGPDSDSVVYTEDGKLTVLRNFAACNESTTMEVLTTGASEPDWSPADLAPGDQTFELVKAPVVTGRAKVGSRLTASRGTWTPAPSAYAITWLRNGTAVHTGATYTLTKADRGKRIQVRVTVRKPGFENRTATSAAVRVAR